MIIGFISHAVGRIIGQLNTSDASDISQIQTNNQVLFHEIIVYIYIYIYLNYKRLFMLQIWIVYSIKCLTTVSTMVYHQPVLTIVQ